MTTDFGSWRLPEEHFGRLMRLPESSGMEALEAEVQLLGAARLRARPLSAYAGIQEIWPGIRPLSGGVPPVADALLDVILEPIDEALQRLYRSCLDRVDPDVPTDQRIEALRGVEDDAHALVEQYDWAWLGQWFQASGGSATWALRRLSNRAFPVRRVTIRFTYHCNISCRHCYNGSGPEHLRTQLPWDGMAEVIADMGRLGIPELTLTGGEPLLYVENVTRAIRHARHHRVGAVRIFTNGFWARSPDAARRMLAQLVDAGFGAGPDDGVKLSAGAYHQEYLPVELVAFAATAHFEILGRPLAVDIETNQAGQGAEEILDVLARLAPSVPVRLHSRDVVGAGRGIGVMNPVASGGQTPCRLIDQVTFEPDGSCRPCCGFNADNAGVRVGRLGSDRLPALIKKIQNDALLQYIARTPLLKLHTLTGGTLPASRRPCELCEAAVGHLTEREPVLRRLASAQRYYPFWFAPEDR